MTKDKTPQSSEDLPLYNEDNKIILVNVLEKLLKTSKEQEVSMLNLMKNIDTMTEKYIEMINCPVSQSVKIGNILLCVLVGIFGFVTFLQLFNLF